MVGFLIKLITAPNEITMGAGWMPQRVERPRGRTTGGGKKQQNDTTRLKTSKGLADDGKRLDSLSPRWTLRTGLLLGEKSL